MPGGAGFDPGFGDGGVYTVPTPGDIATTLAIQPDGKIVVAGRTPVGYDATVHRLTAAGVPDPGFGTGGIVRLDAGGTEYAAAVALQPDGKILVGGGTAAGDNENGFVVRLRADGTRDQGFGGGDGASVLAGTELDAMNGIGVQPDGGIVVAGDDGRIDPDVLVYRLLGDGTPAGPGVTGGRGARPRGRSRPCAAPEYGRRSSARRVPIASGAPAGAT